MSIVYSKINIDYAKKWAYYIEISSLNMYFIISYGLPQLWSCHKSNIRARYNQT